MPNIPRLPRRLLAAVLSTVLGALTAGCATVAKYDASSDIHSFLVAVRDGDDAAFEAHVDRRARKDSLKARLMEAAASRYGVQSKQTLGAIVLAGPLASVAVDGLVRPQVFAAAASLMGYGPETAIPNPIFIARQVKPLGDDRVCVIARAQCVFIFKHEEGSWRMIAFEGDLGLLDRIGGRAAGRL